MANLTMDLTGADTLYQESGRVFRVFKYGQYVDFETTVFADSVKVYLISSGISEPVELSAYTDFVFPDKAVCDNDTSSAKLVDPSFSKTLVSGIELRRGIEENNTYTISVTYQRLYPKQLTTAYYHGVPVEVTPELIFDMIQSIERLKVLASDVTDVGSLYEGDSIFLEQDESYTNDNNYIENEEHQINVSGGRFAIHPKGGSFYRDSIKITYPATGAVLQENVDYVITGMDEAKTKVTSSTVPVYNFIFFIVPISGTVYVSYHAFGGDPTLDNYRTLLKNMNNVIHYLNDVEFLTSANLGQTDVLTSVLQRIDTLEDQVRRLQGTPSYGDITSGKCILAKWFAETQGLHWYTIASLYLVDGRTSPCTADTFVFRLQTELSHIQFTAAVAVDLYNNAGDRFNTSILIDNYPRGYVPFTDYTKVDSIIRPQIRVIWNEGDVYSGLLLQVGFELKGMLEETVSIEDISGHESCWKLVDETAEVTLPSDNLVMLPSGNATWSTALTESLQESMLVPYRNGHLIWNGDQRLNATTGWEVFEATDHKLDKSVDISRIKKLRLDIEEIQGHQFPIDVQFNAHGETRKGHASFTHQNAPAYVNVEMYRDSSNNIVVRLNYDITAGTESNPLSLRDMVVYL